MPAEADAVANFLIELGSNGIVEESPVPRPVVAFSEQTAY